MNWDNFVDLADGYKISLLMALLFANVGTGIAVGLRTNSFLWKKMGEFLYSRVLPMVLGYLSIVLVAAIDNTWETAIPAVWALILAVLAASILENLKQLGLPIPNIPFMAKKETDSPERGKKG